MIEKKEFKSIYLNIETGECVLNGKPMLGVSYLSLEFYDGEWHLLITKDEIYEPAAAN